MIKHAKTCEWATVAEGCACGAMGPATSVETAAALVSERLFADGSVSEAVVDGMRDLLRLACKAVCLWCGEGKEPVTDEVVRWRHRDVPEAYGCAVECYASAIHDMLSPWARQPAPKPEAS